MKVAIFSDGTAKASSFEPPHAPALAFDGNINTIWHTEDYKNAWISVTYPNNRFVTQVDIIPGSLKQFNESACLKDLRVRFSAGLTQNIHLNDNAQVQTYMLTPPVLTSELRFEITGLYPGKTNHIIVPEIVVRGYRP